MHHPSPSQHSWGIWFGERRAVGGAESLIYTGCVSDTVEPQMPFEPDPVIEAYKASIDRSLLRERLERTPTERLEDLAALAKFAEHLAEAGRRARTSR